MTTLSPVQLRLSLRKRSKSGKSIFHVKDSGSTKDWEATLVQFTGQGRNVAQKQSKGDHGATESGMTEAVCDTAPEPRETARASHALDHSINSDIGTSLFVFALFRLLKLS